MAFDVEAIRAQFPILARQVHGKPLIYLDTAASAQKPEAVLDAMMTLARTSYANVHRGLHTLANETTEAYEKARESVAGFINADPSEIVWTKSATEAVNLVADTFGRSLKAGDEIVLSEMEHHANIVPWHFLRERYGVVLRFTPVTDDGRLDMEAFKGLLNERTKMVAISHMSNVPSTLDMWPSATCPTCWARSMTGLRSFAWPTRPGPWCCWTAARPSSTPAST